MSNLHLSVFNIRFNKYALHLLCFIFFSSLNNPFLAQENNTSFKELQVKGQKFDLHTNVIFEDSYGFLWFGTYNGLYRYDGYRLIEYQHDVFNKNSIPNNTINSIVEDKNKNLWIGCASYLSLYNRNKNEFKGFFKKNRAIPINDKINNNSTVWVNLEDDNYLKIDSKKNTDSLSIKTNFSNGHKKIKLSPENHNRSFLEDYFGRLWIATKNGIKFLDKDLNIKSSNLSLNTKILHPYTKNSFFAITETSIYVISYRKEDHSLQILEEYTNKIPNKKSNTSPSSFCISKNGKELWISSNNILTKGVRKNNRFVFKTIEFSKYFSKSQINSLTIDRFNNLWIATSKGVYKHLKHSSIFERISFKKNNSTLNTIFKDKKNNIYGGFKNGEICVLNNDKKNSTCIKPLNKEANISLIKYDYNKEEIFISIENKLLKSVGFNRGLKNLDFKTIKSYDEIIKYFLPINNKEIWIGLWGGGIDIINNNNITLSKFKKKLIKALKGVYISTMHLDRFQTLWIGTRGKGLYKIDLSNENFTQYSPVLKNGINSNAVLCISENLITNKLYIGTRGGGLNIYNYKTESFKSYGKKNGLPSSTITAIEFDYNNDVWLSTQRGISKFTPINNNFVNFNSDDGVNQSEFSYDSSFKSKQSKELYFGYANGIYKVKTSNYKKNYQKTNTIITEFAVLGMQKNEPKTLKQKICNSYIIPLNEKITIPYTDNNVSIKFTSLDLTSPNKNKFAYKLIGVNDYWVYPTNRNANYNNLKHGTYTFKVKSSNSDGIWNDIPASISFTISPPYWKSTLAYITYFIIFMILIYISSILINRWYQLKKSLVVEKFNIKKERELSKTKMVFFTDISHELRTPLTIIQGTIENIINKEKNKLNSKSAQRIQNNSLRMSKLINQIMDIRKLDEDGFKISVTKNELVNNTKDLKKAFDEFARTNLIQFSINCKEENIYGWYDIDIFEKIIFNLLSNAFKYTPQEGTININIEEIKITEDTDLSKELSVGNFMKCSVKDNGLGIAEKDIKFVFDRYYQSDSLSQNKSSGTGIGMALVYKLIQKHHGKISVNSIEGEFTEFTFWLPLEKSLYSVDEISKRIDPNRLPITQKPEFQIDYQHPLTNLKNNSTDIHSKSKILIVEDNDEQRYMLAEELAEDYTIIKAKNGSEGYDKAISEKPQLIISDVYMPKKDGITLLKELKKNNETSHIPVFMLTARDTKDIKLQCISIGAHDYIEKPYSIEFIKWKIHNTLLSRNLLKKKYSKLLTLETSENNSEVESNDDKFIRQIITIIENSLDDSKLNVAFLAKEAGMSRANLYRKLQSTINETPVNFIKQIRLKRACQLLKKDNMYISEIAYMTGFNNQHYFTKCFKSAFGISPSKYSKQFTQNKSNNFITEHL